MGGADEIDAALARHGLAPADLRSVVVTHSHVDHIDGLARLPAAIVGVGADELRLLRRPAATAARRLMRTPLPSGFDPAPLICGPSRSARSTGACR